MFLQKHKIDLILNLVFIVLGPFLQIINVDRLVLGNHYKIISNHHSSPHISHKPIHSVLSCDYA